MGIFDFLGRICGIILWFFYDLFDSYGFAIVCFTLILLLIMFPFEIKRIHSMAQTSKISKKTKEIQEKYKNNREKMSEEMSKLYKEEGNPMKGCLIQVLPSFAFFGIFAAIRQPLSLMFGMSSEKIKNAVDALASVPNLAGTYDNNYAQLEVIKHFSEISSKLTMFDAKDIQNIVDFKTGIKFLGIDLLSMAKGSPFESMLWVLPLIAAITALIPFIFKKLNTAMPVTPEGPGKGCTKIMPVFFVGLFVWMAWVSPAALGVYYIVSNIFRIGQSYIINKFYNVNIYTAKREAARIALLEQEEASVERDYGIKKNINTDQIKKKK